MHEFKHLKQHIQVLISKEQFEKMFYFPRIRLLFIIIHAITII